MSLRCTERDEWLQADGLGGFATGTATGVRTRRYHGLLLVQAAPPAGRFMLVNGVEAWLSTPEGIVPLSAQRYAPDVLAPEDPARRIDSFEFDPWPMWSYRVPMEGKACAFRVEHELFVPRDRPCTVLRWRLRGGGPSAALGAGCKLHVRLLMSGRDYHALHHENGSFSFEPRGDSTLVPDGQRFEPYPGVPKIRVASNGTYRHEPAWYRQFSYAEERARGHDHLEDLASPGVYTFDLSSGDALLILAAEGVPTGQPMPLGCRNVSELHDRLRDAQTNQLRMASDRFERAAEAYIVRRPESHGGGKSIIAGYPWFTDWGRDTFIALRGLCLALGRIDVARDIVMRWAGNVSQGLLPNRFPDQGEEPEYNTIDAALWYVIAADEYMRAAAAQQALSPDDATALKRAIISIIAGYARGTHYNIRLEDDGLISGGASGWQLTWMDAKVNGWVVTPRVGKPVEIQALWLNALAVARRFDLSWEKVLQRGIESFAQRFWNPDAQCLYDVVDENFRPGLTDAQIRPNQILAVGGLPLCVLDPMRARAVVDLVESKLLTPVGLRSLAPGSQGYRLRYEGGPLERDFAYHQGTVWGWLMGPFVEAWVRVRGGTTEAKRQARERFLSPLIAHMQEAGLGHVSEIFDAEAPYTPRGAPFQAWSLGELIRLDRVVLAEPPRATDGLAKAIAGTPAGGSQPVLAGSVRR
ncbi:MAG: amylo-alpha-1,6-glucosidase [Planctomycetota bacterium]|nr:amylo-alpha-1,6-glucosidase [Planctomycetota bacterium]